MGFSTAPPPSSPQLNTFTEQCRTAPKRTSIPSSYLTQTWKVLTHRTRENPNVFEAEINSVWRIAVAKCCCSMLTFHGNSVHLGTGDISHLIPAVLTILAQRRLWRHGATDLKKCQEAYSDSSSLGWMIVLRLFRLLRTFLQLPSQIFVNHRYKQVGLPKSVGSSVVFDGAECWFEELLLLGASLGCDRL